MRNGPTIKWKILIAAAVLSGVVLIETAVVLANAGFHADATATLTPANEGLWIRALSSLVILAVAVLILGPVRAGSRHPFILVTSGILLALSVSLFAFGVYWWWAAGSYVDMTNRQMPASLWKSYRVMGTALLATPLLVLATALLARPEIVSCDGASNLQPPSAGTAFPAR